MSSNTMRRRLKLIGTVISPLLAMLSGCAGQPTTSFEPFTPEDLNTKLQSGYTQKVDDFLVIVDASDSMDSTYLGTGFPESSSWDKFSVAKEFLRRMNQTIPELKLNAGLRTFGFGPCLSWSFTKLNAPLAPYSAASFQSNLDSMECSSGGSPMGKALHEASSDLQASQGNVALILVSDGKQAGGEPREAVKRLKQQLGDRLCLHTVWVDNPHEPGQALMGILPVIAGCGTSSAVGDVVSSAGAGDFVTKVFLKPGAVQDCSTRDSDADGVNDCDDHCQDSPKGAKVNRAGCWVLTNVLFDTDKATIKPASHTELDEVVKVFDENPGLRVEVDGHTDSRGSDAHNLDLSQRRAEAVLEYLVRHGVAVERLAAKGFGESKPVADNESVEGMSLNRRVELNVMK